MNRFVFFVLFGLIAVATAQWNNQPFPQVPQPQFPSVNELCKQPGANCKIDSRFAEENSYSDNQGHSFKNTRVCDNNGCYDRKVSKASSSSPLSVSFLLLAFCASLIKLLLQ